MYEEQDATDTVYETVLFLGWENLGMANYEYRNLLPFVTNTPLHSSRSVYSRITIRSFSSKFLSVYAREVSIYLIATVLVAPFWMCYSSSYCFFNTR